MTDSINGAPVLQLPDAEEPFVVEEDASDVGAGEVLLQRVGPGKKLHLCTFFSHRLSPLSATT